MSKTIEEYLPELAAAWEISLDRLHAYYGELQENQAFLAAINRAILDVPEFAGTQFSDVSELRLYRSLLYLLTRAFRPEVFVETGVLNGFSSAFVLLAMQHNSAGTLHSIDLPPVDERIRMQGTGPLPQGKAPGWAIPDGLRTRHCLLLGDARVLLPQILERQGPIEVFLHDSDHSYEHMMFEMALAWPYLRPGGWLLCDNVEQNSAFADFVRGVNANSSVVASFDSPERTWKHGMARKSRLSSGPVK
jgi:predicted O-methyltransferase YrrM